MPSIFDTIDARRDPVMIGDRLSNLVSGLGTQKDKAAHGRFGRVWLDKDELDSMYEGDFLSGLLVDAPADDMTRAWRSWDGGKNQVAALDRAEKALRVKPRVNLALKQSRLYGGSVILLGTGDADPSLPLDVESLPRGGLQYLHVLSRHEISTTGLIRDPLDPDFGQPAMYQLGTGQGASTTGSVDIHPSRVIRFLGQAKLETTRAADGWGGLSVLQRAYDALRNAASAQAALASLLQEAKVDVIKIPELTERVTDDGYRASMLARFGLAAQTKAINGMLILDAAEEYEQKSINLASLPDVLAKFLELVAAAANMPITRLLGKSSTGLSATGEHDLVNYYDMIAGRQEVELRPGLERLDIALKRHALGSTPDKLDYSWNSLWQMSAPEKADLALKKAQATMVLVKTGTIPFDALATGVQSQLVEDGTYPEFETALATAKMPIREPSAAMMAAQPNDPADPADPAQKKEAGGAIL